MPINFPKAEITGRVTKDGLTVYDLEPQAGELYAVAGPAGYDARTIDQDALPEGFRWVEESEWEQLGSNAATKHISLWLDETSEETAHWIVSRDTKDTTDTVKSFGEDERTTALAFAKQLAAREGLELRGE